MFKNFLDNALTRKIVLLVGVVSIFGAGLYFAITSDLLLMNSSLWLFLSIICAFGSGACLALSDLIKNNKTAFYIMRGLGIVLAILLIVVIVIYPQLYQSTRKSDGEIRSILQTLKEEKKYSTATVVKYIALSQIPTIVFASITIAFQGFGLAQNIICGIDE